MVIFERRITTRQLQQGQAMFATANAAFLVQINDISKGGCQILRPRSWSFNIGDTGRLYLFGDTGPVPTYAAQVAWYQEELVGLEFAP